MTDAADWLEKLDSQVSAAPRPIESTPQADWQKRFASRSPPSML
jgi:hypothetical protein